MFKRIDHVDSCRAEIRDSDGLMIELRQWKLPIKTNLELLLNSTKIRLIDASILSH